ncbi:ImmA/IrrE family metallo-endopeptidase [Paenibacillus chitinolyticus]|uniref:ImmA/IrrE family metallo-endopeptidase n=1 Tax=Paenibacillus chitinolyticus TaxID=79263 RepID=A0A410X580_9BACL|nr:ImmA/IrrE family metallo-endopeptidase [Paenibacillus chitinolyticus]MCY9593760.1 ImmA/IrrE family metallo-endopeptidase [Paenibacillus chitinolyticus]MCY9599675.1 ImmA/IrrE family metallo-endopeptidase [Paenibacillus chitinolyticus]QAV21771.1 ImmA/IrrE family metallo-endopeptidase [Paenibacillus chitinolyticus]
MENSAYQKTYLEIWIENLYRSQKITIPQQLNVIEVASRLNVWVYWWNSGSESFERNGMMSIFLDRRLPQSQQWLDFLHELCHLLRHWGKQFDMPKEFRELQEWQASHFVMYASIPYYMYESLPLPDKDSEAAEALKSEFGVPIEMAYARIQQIRRRILQGICDQRVNLLYG